MNGTEILRIVDAIHRDKAIDAEIVFEGIEQAILSAARKHFSEEEQLEVRIDRDSGEPALICDGRMLDPELLGDLLGRISAQTAKQVMIQKIREAERDALYEEYLELRSQLISGQVTRVDRGTVIVSLGKVEAILPRSEQIRKENYRTGVGVRGARIRGIVEELAGERIEIVRWNDSLSILVPNALQPAEVEDVILCPMLGKVIVLVREDQLSLAIGKFGQNVRLASKLVGWDIHVMTQDLLDQQLDKSIVAFCVVPEVTAELAENLVSQGFFTFDDLSVIEPDQLAEIGGLSDEDCDKIVEYADRESQRLEAEEKIAAELKKQTAVYGEAAKPKTAPPVTEASIQEPETVPPEIILDSSAALEE